MNLWVTVTLFTIVQFFPNFMASEEVIRYDNYHWYQIFPSNDRQLQILQDLYQKNGHYTFLNFPTLQGHEISVIVAPVMVNEFSMLLNTEHFNYNILLNDVQEMINNELLATTRSGAQFDWTAYYNLEAIYEWLDKTVSDYPNLVTIDDIGDTYHGRKLRVVKISHKSGNPGVFIEGGIHAREWISVAFVTYLINELVTSNDPNIQFIAQNYDWYILPVANPDGYAYTHSNDRFWRKNRYPNKPICYGTDLNRNWNFHWMEHSSSSDPCSDIYAGSKAASESETVAYVKYLNGLKGKIQTFLAFHAYSQLILFPYGHTAEPVVNYDDLFDIATAAKNALAQRYGTKYTVGTVYETIYPASGSSVDYAYALLNVSLAYAYELRPAMFKSFVLPPDQIIPTSEETLDSIVALLSAAENLGYYTKK